MPRRVLTTPEADADLDAAFAWYERHLPGLGTDFLAEVAVVLTYLEAFPDGYAEIRGRTRRAIVHRFPYSVFYIVDRDAVIVTAVMHLRRDPQAWPG